MSLHKLYLKLYIFISWFDSFFAVYNKMLEGFQWVST